MQAEWFGIRRILVIGERWAPYQVLYQAIKSYIKNQGPRALNLIPGKLAKRDQVRKRWQIKKE